MRGMWKRSYGRATKAPPDERGGNRHAQPTATAPHPDSTRPSHWHSTVKSTAVDPFRNFGPAYTYAISRAGSRSARLQSHTIPGFCADQANGESSCLRQLFGHGAPSAIHCLKFWISASWLIGGVIRTLPFGRTPGLNPQSTSGSSVM